MNFLNMLGDFLMNEVLNVHQHQQQVQHDMEMAHMAATGIEFGGFNPDPNLNPGMMSGMMNDGMF